MNKQEIFAITTAIKLIINTIITIIGLIINKNQIVIIGLILLMHTDIVWRLERKSGGLIK